ncbi:MAG: recombinase family protein [Candidatus Pacebacteria bacterium]|nr:recombinase family protein [Candidatus Paceibacterota bacterium]
MRAVILARVSTPRQEKEGLSLKEIQLPTLREYATERGFEVAEKDEFVFQESADSKIRKKFDEMIEYVKKHKDIGAIITFRVDRITRNFRDAVALDSLMRDFDKEIHFVNDRLIINKNSSGKEIQDWDLKVFLAKQTINRLKDDERISRARKLENGELPGGAPFGYKNVTLESKKKWVVPDEFKSQVVKAIFDWYVSGNYSILEIVRKLKKDYDIKKSKSAVHFILNNRFYIGVIVNSGRQYPHKYEQIIKKETFDKAQALMNKRNARSQPFKYAGKEFAYRGLITCQQCGCRITPELKKRKLESGGYNFHIYYHCTNYHHTHDKVLNVKESTLDVQFAELFENLEIPREKLEELTTSLRESHQDKNHFIEQELTYLTGQLKQQRTRVSTAYEDRLNGSITIEKFEEIRKKAEAKEAELKEKIANIEKANREYYMTTSRLVEIGSRSADIFSRSKPHEKRALLNLVLQNATLDGEKVRYKVKFPFSMVLKYAPSSSWLPEPQLFGSAPIKEHFDHFLEAIQDIRYMGQMKQRWLEIKKLQTGAALYDVRA